LLVRGAALATSDSRNVSVFVRGMLISDDERELLPSWAGFCGAVLESDRLKPTASREDLQKDTGWDDARALVESTLIEGLSHLARRAPAAWRLVLHRHNEALLGAAVSVPALFQALGDDLKVPTSEGDWTLPALRAHARKAGREGRIYVTLGQRGSYEEMLFRAMKVPVVSGTRFAALPFTERFAQKSGLQVVRIGTREGDAALFRPADVSGSAEEALEDVFGGEGREVHPVRFQPSWLPCVLVPDREAELKQRMESDTADRRITGNVLGLARLYVATIAGEVRTHVYVNVACPAVQALLTATPDKRERAGRLLRSSAELMGGHEEHVGIDIERALRDLGALATELAGGATEEDN
jgi:molecular chaperone HtpG